MTRNRTKIGGVKRSIVMAICLSLLGLSANAAVNESEEAKLAVENKISPFDIKEIKKGVVYFAEDGSQLETPFKALNPIGTMDLELQGVPPFLLFSAKPCVDDQCEDRKVLYLVRADGQVKTTFVYPGKVRDRKSRRLLLDSRAFYGKCLPNKGEIFIVFQKEKLDRRRGLRRSVFLAEVSKDRIQEKLIIRRRPRLRNVIRQVKRNQCEEIKGYNRLTMDFQIPRNPPKKDDPSKT